MEAFKIGDLVKVKENISLGTSFTTCSLVESMLKYRGRITRIKEVEMASCGGKTCPRYILDLDRYYVFDPEMLELMAEYSITSDNSSLTINKSMVSSISQPIATITQVVPKFKIGDKVIIKDDLIIHSVYDGWCLFTESMKKYCGKSTIVNSFSTPSSFGKIGYYLDNIHDVIFSDEMLELVEEPSIKLKNLETLKLFL